MIGILDLAGDGIHRTVPGALAAALAQLGNDLQMALAAVADGAVVIDDMGQILLAEVAQRALHGLAGALTKAAERGFRDGLGQLFVDGKKFTDWV